MTKVVLLRCETSDQGTFGILEAPGLRLYTGELPWRDNAANISCIPGGNYQAVWSYSFHFKRPMYALIHVPSRAGIRIHSANLMGDAAKGFRSQLNGCIALGEAVGAMRDQRALFASAPAVRRFEALMAQRPFMLEVRNNA